MAGKKGKQKKEDGSKSNIVPLIIEQETKATPCTVPCDRNAYRVIFLWKRRM